MANKARRHHLSRKLLSGNILQYLSLQVLFNRYVMFRFEYFRSIASTCFDLYATFELRNNYLFITVNCIIIWTPASISSCG